jgi:hypothetical protein
MDWFKGKTSPEIIDFPMKYSGFRVKKKSLENRSIEHVGASQEEGS